MKRFNILLVMSALIGSFASCSQDAENELVPSAQVVNFDVNISKTRIVTEGKVTSFVEDDQIGVFGVKRGASEVLNQNVMYAYTGSGKWLADKSITYPLDNSPINFYAYYPYGDHPTTNFDFTVLSDQSKDNGYAQSDLLVAKNEKALPGEGAVSLQFGHMMAQIEVKPALPDGVTLTSVALLNVLTGSSVDLINQTATTKTDASASLSTITLMKAGDVYRGVLPKQTLAGRIFEFVGINEAGQKVMFDYTLENATALTANKITLFEINLQY